MGPCDTSSQILPQDQKCELCLKCSDACLETLASPDYESPLLGLNELELK